MALLEARDLVKSFRGRVVVRGVSLDVNCGEIVGLLGPNGAGKTTSFKMIMGLLRPDSGEVRLQDHLVTRLPIHERARKGLGYLQQEPSIFQGLTVWQNIEAVLEFHEGRRKKRKETIAHLLEELELTRLKDSLAKTLSGGERRRLEITRALAVSPRVLLLDEPFSGVDPLAVEEMQDLIRSLRDRGIAILITDHNVREILSITDRSCIIQDGKVIREGSPQTLTEDPLVRKVYLGKRFRL